MPAMEDALCSYLLTKSVVTNIIGTGASARIYAIVLPQGYNVDSGAAATYEIISSTEEHTLSDRCGFVQSRVQIATYAKTHTAAMTLARAIKNCGIAALKGVSSSVDFRGVTIDDGIQCYAEPPTDGSTEWRYIAEFDLMISYLEE